eukprot:750610-Amphidinium_carterae.1
MPRFTIDGDPISVAFGYEDDPGLANVFLTVCDSRLQYKLDASEAVNSVTEQLFGGDGGGAYFELHTGRRGFGIKVDHKTMGVYLKRFGIPQEKIDALPLRIPKPSWAQQVAEATAAKASAPSMGICAVCCKPGTKKCGKCHSMLYCSESCQKQNWKAHKVFCALHPFPASLPNIGRSVQAILLPDEDKAPRVVQVPLKECYDDEDGRTSFLPQVKQFLGDTFS